MSDLVDRVVEAMKATELRIGPWHPNYLRELACAAIEAVRAHEKTTGEFAGVGLPSEPQTDRQAGQRSEKLHAPFAGPGVWALF
jgi:hypothetical protein